MPSAYTHIFIGNSILERLNTAQDKDNGSIKLELESVDESGQKHPVMLNKRLITILQQNKKSFLAGTISPDFFPDIFWGITISHQPYLKKKNLADFLSTFGESIDFADDKQIAYLYGWLSHICADIFGHHWVGMEAKGDFETWFSTDEEIIRKHIGIEMCWDKQLPSIKKEVIFERALIQSAMLSYKSTLANEYYNYKNYKSIYAIIQLNRLGEWHGEQATKITQFRDKIQKKDSAIVKFLRDSCPSCNGLGLLKKLMPERCVHCKGRGILFNKLLDNCPICKATGIVSDKIPKNCTYCDARGKIEESIQNSCPTCNASGFIKKNCHICNTVGKIAKKCPICGGDGKIDCGVCGGDGKVTKTIFGRRVKVPCPICIGTGGVPCPSHIINQTCPTCQGAKLLKKTCPTCSGLKLVSKVNKVTCPVCNGLKITNEIIEKTCPNCNGSKIIKNIVQKTCPECFGKKVIDLIKNIPCPVCMSVDPLILICNHLIDYHKHRQEHIVSIADNYITSHENISKCILNNQLGEIIKCYEPFWNEVKHFIATQLTFIDLIAPELHEIEEACIEFIEKALENFKDMVVPEWIEDIKALIVRETVIKILDLLNLTLTDDEEKYYIEIFNKYQPPQNFPPLFNAIQLFLLALNQVTPDLKGLKQAVTILDKADNIDKRCQPFMTKAFEESFWSRFFYDFIDGLESYDYCQAQGLKVR